MENSWLRLYRRLLQWEWFTDSKTLHVFIYLLLAANFKDGYMKGQPVKRGQVVTSYFRIATSTGMSISSVRRAVDNLVSTGEITLETTNRYSMITVVKYDSYQDKYAVFEHTTEQTDEHTSEHTTEQHHKKNRRRKKEEEKTPVSVKAEPKEQPKEDQHYIPEYWEREIPKVYWGRFQVEDDWWQYVEEHREEVEAVINGV